MGAFPSDYFPQFSHVFPVLVLHFNRPATQKAMNDFG